ncbi:hypothetical protein [Streptomyces sp. SID13031]|uniref:hypothetical protein n=1 Tax=Streptomyces sp. SID13031 TaxID=2706046 RepID=UPI0013CB1CEE|nr:hypothetical protein [Streptomyces sp. SID13031]NEA33097.1 hypothetical protein [Streptomyces sp. SID13031]
MASKKNSPEAQAIINEYEAAARESMKYATNDKSPAAKKAHTRFDKADKRRWKWR